MGLDPNTLPMSMLNKMPSADRKPLGKAGVTTAEADARNAIKREKELQQRCIALLRQRNILCNSSRMDRRKTDKTGWPDLTFSFPSHIWKQELGFPLGIPCAFECKISGAHPTPDQVKVMEQMMDNGWYVRVIYSEEQFVGCLKHLEALTLGTIPITNLNATTAREIKSL